MKAYAKCECGETKCPQRASNAAAMRDAVTTWFLEHHFAELVHGSLVCRVCKAIVRVRIDPQTG